MVAYKRRCRGVFRRGEGDPGRRATESSPPERPDRLRPRPLPRGARGRSGAVEPPSLRGAASDAAILSYRPCARLIAEDCLAPLATTRLMTAWPAWLPVPPLSPRAAAWLR